MICFNNFNRFAVLNTGLSPVNSQGQKLQQCCATFGPDRFALKLDMRRMLSWSCRTSDCPLCSRAWYGCTAYSVISSADSKMAMCSHISRDRGNFIDADHLWTLAFKYYSDNTDLPTTCVIEKSFTEFRVIILALYNYICVKVLCIYLI